MRHHHEEAHTLQHHVGIDIDEGIATEFDTTGLVLLNGKLIDGRTEVGGIVLREESSVGSEFYTQHFGNLELQIEVREEVPVGQRQHILITAVLIGDDVLPVQRTKTEVLVQLGGEQMNIASLLKQTCRHLGAVVFGGYIAHAIIEIVLYLVDG